jgi:predicted unusual protein kinase regulating ubiquinone biosynthesis (AarF/ABC1/UbiB family)
MIWVLGILGALLALVLLFPVPRRALVLTLIAIRRGVPILARKLRLVSKRHTTARQFRLAFEDLGPAYLKFGQMVASSPTAFSKETTEEFSKCLDEVRPISKSAVWRIVAAELAPRPIDEVFAEIEEQPLASASIAQVHAATLANGTPVVIKVQRPGIKRRVEADLALMGFWARLAEWCSKLMRHANLSGIVNDFRGTIREEMDFRLEADNIEHFNALLDREGLLGLARAPRVYRDISTDKILVLERFYGCRIDDKPGVDARVDNVVDMLRNTSEVFWSCVLLGGFFHGDIHAGNIMVLDDGRLGYIDFGIFGRFSDSNRIALADWLGAMVSGDGEQLARAIYDMGAIKKKDLDWNAYVADVTEVFLPLRALTVDNPKMLEEFFPKVRDLGGRHDLHLPQSFVLILKQLAYFGRYVMMHEPSFNENLDPKSQQTFVKIFMKFNAWRQGADGGEAIAIRPSA